MPDITIHRHGDRWSVLEAGAESPAKEFPSREAAELAARQMAAGGTVDVVEDDPTGLEETRAAGDTEAGTGGPGAMPVDSPESTRAAQPGL